MGGGVRAFGPSRARISAARAVVKPYKTGSFLGIVARPAAEGRSEFAWVLLQQQGAANRKGRCPKLPGFHNTSAGCESWMPKQELQDAECYLRSLQATGLWTQKGRARRLQPETLSSEEQHSANHHHQIVEQVKAGGHKMMACWNSLPGGSAFGSQDLGHKNANLCTVLKSRLYVICNYARNALSKANNSKSVKPLQCFCTGL